MGGGKVKLRAAIVCMHTLKHFCFCVGVQHFLTSEGDYMCECGKSVISIVKINSHYHPTVMKNLLTA